MLGAPHKIEKADFSNIFSKGRFFHSPLLSLRILKEGHIPQFAVIVSKKAIPTAVGRNSARRRVYAVLERIIKRIEPVSGLITIKTDLKKVSFTVLEKEVHTLFEKGGISLH
jgi:ribonuclease P protein component